jgi:hypothetical protein
MPASDALMQSSLGFGSDWGAAFNVWLVRPRSPRRRQPLDVAGRGLDRHRQMSDITIVERFDLDRLADAPSIAARQRRPRNAPLPALPHASAFPTPDRLDARQRAPQAIVGGVGLDAGRTRLGPALDPIAGRLDMPDAGPTASADASKPPDPSTVLHRHAILSPKRPSFAGVERNRRNA